MNIFGNISRAEIERELNTRGYSKGAVAVPRPPIPGPAPPQELKLPPPRLPARPPFPPPEELAPPMIVAEVPVVPIEIPPEEAGLVPTWPPITWPPTKRTVLIIGGGIAFLVLAQAFAKKEEE